MTPERSIRWKLDSPVTAVTLFTMIWWTVLFAVLPFGTRPVAEPDEATGWRGAPALPHMLRKIVVTTVISMVLFGALLPGDPQRLAQFPQWLARFA